MTAKKPMNGAMRNTVDRLKGLQSAHKTAIVIALLALLWMLSGIFKSTEQGAVTHGDGPVVPRVRAQTLHSEAHTPSIVLLGRTVAGQAVNVSAEITGRVTEIVAQKGETVEAGAVLLRISAEDRAQRLAEAKARLKQREIGFETARKPPKGGDSSQSKVALAEADLEAARALVTRMERELANTKVVAPFAGVVDAIPVEVGDYFDKAGQIAARVLDLSTIKAVGQVTERDIIHVTTGGPATLRLPGGREVQGRVSFVGMSSNALTRTFPVEVTAEIPARDVPEGVTAEITLPLDAIVGHLISPALLTLDDQGQIGVKTVNGQNEVEFHGVEMATDTLGGAWLTGLPDAVRVITVGQEFVSVGTVVEPVEGELPSMFPASDRVSSDAQPEPQVEN